MLDDKQTLIAGTVRAEDAGAGSPRRYYNSAYVFDSDGQIVSAADKVHLVPFGEYMPFADLLRSWGVDTIAALPGGYTAAVSPNLLTLPGGRQFYPLICYEAIFPEEIGRLSLSRLGADQPHKRHLVRQDTRAVSAFSQAQVTAVELGFR